MLPTKLAREPVLSADRLATAGDVQVRQLGEACAGFFLLVATQQCVLFDQFETVSRVVCQMSQPPRNLPPEAAALSTFWPTPSMLNNGAEPQILRPFWPTAKSDTTPASASTVPQDPLSRLGFPFTALEKVWIESFHKSFAFFDTVQRSFSTTAAEAAFDPAVAVSEMQCIRAEGAIAVEPCADAAVSPPQDAAFDPAELHFGETLVQMLLLLLRASPRGLLCFEQSSHSWAACEPFKKFGIRKLNEFIGRQKFILEREPERTLATLPDRLTSPSDRRRALETVALIAGPILQRGEPKVTDLWARLAALLTPAGARSTVEITKEPCGRSSLALREIAE
jgi:hypothetical protein